MNDNRLHYPGPRNNVIHILSIILNDNRFHHHYPGPQHMVQLDEIDHQPLCLRPPQVSDNGTSDISQARVLPSFQLH